MQALARFDVHPISDEIKTCDVPPGDLNEMPEWPDIIDACEGLSLDEPFEVYTLAERWLDYPAGTISVTCRDRVYLQPAPIRGLSLTVSGRVPVQTASGVGCTACPLHRGRTLIVDGVGEYQPRVMIIGEAPGREEDAAGSPFVGKSGQLLKALLGEAGFAGRDYYLTNIVRCRPPGNRQPTKDEIKACSHWLREEVQRVKPESILLLGATARDHFDRSTVPPETPIWHMLHPAYLLRNPGKTGEWRRDIAAFAQAIGVIPVVPTSDPGGRVVPTEWGYGSVDHTADVVAIDTETRSLEDDYGSDLVTVQASEGRRAQLYLPVHHLGGSGGPVRLPRTASVGPVHQGVTDGVLLEVVPVPEGGRESHLSQPALPEPRPYRGRDASGELSEEPRPEDREDRQKEKGIADGVERSWEGPAVSSTSVGNGHRPVHPVAVRQERRLRPGREATQHGVCPPGSVEPVEPHDNVGDIRRGTYLRDASLRESQAHQANDAGREHSHDLGTPGQDGYQSASTKAVGDCHCTGQHRYIHCVAVSDPGTLEADGPEICVGAWFDRRIIAHNAKYDLPRLGMDMRKLDSWEDTALIAYVLRYPRVGLKILGPELTGLDMQPISRILGTGKKAIQFDEALERSPSYAVEYACRDAVATARMFPILYRELAKHPTLLKYYQDMEKPVVPIVFDMEQNGALIDRDALAKLEDSLRDGIGLQKSVAQFWADEDFNPNSGRDIARVVQKLGGVLKDKTPTGALQTDKAALLGVCGVEKLDDLPKHTPLPELIRAVLGYKELGKLLSTYCPALANTDMAGRIHTNFNQMVTDTNRFSSSGPNLQNIPARSALGRKFRACFIARPGYRIVKADFSQLELRIYAHFTKEPILLEAYGSSPEKDVHSLFAAQWGVDRKTAKNGVFGLVYGVEARKLAKTLGIPQSETAGFISRMRRDMPSIAGGWREHIGHLLDEHGYVETLYGWRNYYPGYRSPIQADAQKALREAGNLPIQGTAGGILKMLLKSYDLIREAAFGAVPILMVHDEVVFEVPERYVEAFTRLLKHQARVINPLCVPLVLEVESGPNWAECVPVK